MRPHLALALVLALAPCRAHAQAEAPPIRGPWADYLTPPRDEVTARDARRYVRQGLLFLLAALDPSSSALDDPAWRLLERALMRFEQALPLLPEDVDLAYYVAVTLEHWARPAPDGGIERRVDDAIAAYERVRALDPEYVAARVALDLAMLHARRMELEQVGAEYERALAVDVPEAAVLMGRTYLPNPIEQRLAFLYASIDASHVHGNLAENHMLLGDLDAAVRHYRTALRGAQTPFSRALMHWGLALAQHRAGDADAGLAAARDAIEVNPLADDPEAFDVHRRWGALAVLHHRDVFFEPAYEIHGYHAVGYEAFSLRHDRWRRTGLEAALTSWRRFLVEGGTSSRFAAHARAQVARIEAALATLGDEAEPVPLGDRTGLSGDPWLGTP